MYLIWDEKTITDFSDKNINSLYNEGYLFTREQRGSMYQTRSLRIDLNKFELSSENRRILRKIADSKLRIADLPLSDYHWEIGKMGKDFYETKFGTGIFSANKIKELLTTEHNFNKLFVYNDTAGYCICCETNELLHYSYPFYNLKPKTHNLIPNIGMGMMLRAILYAKENEKKYIYLGSAQRLTDTYKLQFAGIEWWNGKVWKIDLDKLKKLL